MARDGMTWIISVLRTKINDVGSAIWTDDVLQNYLDMHRVHLVREKLISDSTSLIFYSPVGMLESDVSIWTGNHSGSTEIANSNYESNLVDGIFTFSAVQDYGYYLDGKSYNLHGAIAECLEQLAMDPLKAKTWNRGSVSFTHYDLMEMAKYHRSQMGIQSTRIGRVY